LQVLWVNNLEKDADYKAFPRNLQALFQMNFGRLPTIARNIFCVVAIADPLSSGGLAAADLAQTIQEKWVDGWQMCCQTLQPPSACLCTVLHLVTVLLIIHNVCEVAWIHTSSKLHACCT
jgi:hypothetical protein